MDGVTTQKIHFIDIAAVAVTSPNGQNVGKSWYITEDGTSDSVDLIMGVNIAEWAYNRPEVQSSLDS